jgi:four helix bundle protein
MQGYRDLAVWPRGMDLAAETYALTKVFPRDELFGLTSQARRAAASIPANIAEGWGRQTRPAYANHLRIAQGSLKELETHLLLAARIGLTSEAETAPLLQIGDEIGRMLNRLIRTIEAPLSPKS